MKVVLTVILEIDVETRKQCELILQEMDYNFSKDNKITSQEIRDLEIKSRLII